MTVREDYFLGLPAWAFPGWKDVYFSDTPSRLASYARVFNAVEGNTTFYGVPDANSVDRWREAVEGSGFRFCFKLPRDVTHQRCPDRHALDSFLDAIAPLDGHLGPLLVQFPATTGPADLDRLEPVLAAVAERHGFVVEVRHPAFFANPELLEPVLERHGAGRGMLDSRPIFEGNRQHPEVVSALHEKPDVPVLDTVYNDVAFVRLFLHPDIVSNRTYIDEWATRAAQWLDDGIATWMMIHCPNNRHCPPLALDFHDTLRRILGESAMPELESWPVPQQRSLL